MARPYMRREDRRRQIIEATVGLIAEYGVEGATMSRIAANVGITTAAIYGHFANRREVLLAAMDHVCEQVRELRRAARSTSALERLMGDRARTYQDSIGQGWICGLLHPILRFPATRGSS